jgi:hypothetical protein
LKDAEKWIQLRRSLRQQIDAARKFQREYSGRHYENEGLGNLEKTIDNFEKNVIQRITQLDKVSESLIQIVSILTTLTYHTSLLCAV